MRCYIIYVTDHQRSGSGRGEGIPGRHQARRTDVEFVHAHDDRATVRRRLPSQDRFRPTACGVTRRDSKSNSFEHRSPRTAFEAVDFSARSGHTEAVADRSRGRNAVQNPASASPDDTARRTVTSIVSRADDGRVTRIAARMADGREIIYFDESPDAVRVLTDPRDIPPVIPGSQVRFDVVLGEWVGVAGHRQTRTYHPPANACPLCPSTAGTRVRSRPRIMTWWCSRTGSPRSPGPVRSPPMVRFSTPGRATGGVRWCVSPPTTTRRCPRCRCPGCGRSSTPGPTGPRRCPRSRGWSRCSVSRTGAWRSGSPWPTRTGRSTGTRS